MYNKFSENLIDELCPLLESILLKESKPGALSAQTSAVSDALQALADFVSKHPLAKLWRKSIIIKVLIPGLSLLAGYSEKSLPVFPL